MSTNRNKLEALLAEYDFKLIDKSQFLLAVDTLYVGEDEADVETRREAFKEELRPYVEMYGKQMVTDFYLKWSETNNARGKRKKMRKELQPTWDTARRLSTWYKLGQGWKKEKIIKQAQQVNPLR